MNPLLLPLVAAQGRRVRRSTEVLEPAAGPTTGVVDGTGAPLRVSVVGESTAAGCGAPNHDEAFVGALARALAARTGRPVAWEVVGHPGATARRIRHRLVPRLEQEADLVVVLAGVNDVLTGRRPREWADDLTAIVTELGAGARQVVVPGLPSFPELPSLPPALGRYLGERAAAIDRASQLVCGSAPAATWFRSAGTLATGPWFFARDGFHPSSAGYRAWAERTADAVDLARLG